MKERPILFTGEMVRAIIDGRKTQTRRLVKPQPEFCGGAGEESDISKWGLHSMDGTPRFVPVTGWAAPLGTVGDRLWVRENWAHVPITAYRFSEGVNQTADPNDPDMAAVYAAGWELCRPIRWRPSIHMPRWASRIDLEITAVRVERVNGITEEDARKEGVRMVEGLMDETLWEDYVNADNMLPSATQSFASLWQSIYGTWDANPWVWVYEFRRVKR